jgi:hypothetical protein
MRFKIETFAGPITALALAHIMIGHEMHHRQVVTAQYLPSFLL